MGYKENIYSQITTLNGGWGFALVTGKLNSTISKYPYLKLAYRRIGCEAATTTMTNNNKNKFCSRMQNYFKFAMKFV